MKQPKEAKMSENLLKYLKRKMYTCQVLKRDDIMSEYCDKNAQIYLNGIKVS